MRVFQTFAALVCFLETFLQPSSALAFGVVLEHGSSAVLALVYFDLIVLMMPSSKTTSSLPEGPVL